VLGLAKIRGFLPEYLHLVGIQPEDISTGLDLSPTIEMALPEVVSRSVAVLKSWN